MSNHTALIQDLFANITREGWSTKFNDALADDLVWVATGSSPVAGTYEGSRRADEKSYSDRPWLIFVDNRHLDAQRRRLLG